MRVTILTSDTRHPVYPRLLAWVADVRYAEVRIVLKPEEADGGDYLFLISCKDIVGADIRSRYRHTLVVHASALPKRRGWSPLAWSVLAGEGKITVSLLEAEDKVDTGAIWVQQHFEVEEHELLSEINQKLFDAEIELMGYAIRQKEKITPQPQAVDGASYCRRRTPDDSRLDPYKTIADQFDLMRVCDDIRYPAFFDYRGHRYELRLTKTASPENITVGEPSHED